MDWVRVVIALALVVAAYKHASLWGRFFFELYGMHSPLSVSRGYLMRSHRIVFCHLLHVLLLVAIWLCWPFDHWGLLAILVSAYAYRGGMRHAMLTNFVAQLLLNLDSGESFEEAWRSATSTIKALTGFQNLNTDGYFAAPSTLISYVASSSNRQDLSERWTKWVQTQASGSSDIDASGG